MVLKITENTKKCALFTDIDHELYENPDHALDTVTKFWVKKYKAHTKYIQAQTALMITRVSPTRDPLTALLDLSTMTTKPTSLPWRKRWPASLQREKRHLQQKW